MTQRLLTALSYEDINKQKFPVAWCYLFFGLRFSKSNTKIMRFTYHTTGPTSIFSKPQHLRDILLLLASCFLTVCCSNDSPRKRGRSQHYRQSTVQMNYQTKKKPLKKCKKSCEKLDKLSKHIKVPLVVCANDLFRRFKGLIYEK